MNKHRHICNPASFVGCSVLTLFEPYTHQIPLISGGTLQANKWKLAILWEYPEDPRELRKDISDHAYDAEAPPGMQRFKDLEKPDFLRKSHTKMNFKQGQHIVNPSAMNVDSTALCNMFGQGIAAAVFSGRPPMASPMLMSPPMYHGGYYGMHGMHYPQQGSAPSSSWDVPAGVAPKPKAPSPQTTPQKDEPNAPPLPVASPEDGGQIKDDQGSQTGDNPDLSGEEQILRNAMMGRKAARKRPGAVEPSGAALKKPAMAKVGEEASHGAALKKPAAMGRKATVDHLPKPKTMPPPPVGKAGSNPDAVSYRAARCYTKWSEKTYRGKNRSFARP